LPYIPWAPPEALAYNLESNGYLDISFLIPDGHLTVRFPLTVGQALAVDVLVVTFPP
jgi:hypothetical protein